MSQKTCLLLKPHVTDANDSQRQKKELNNIQAAIKNANLKLLGPAGSGIVVQDISIDLIGEVYYADVIVIDVNDYRSATNFTPYLYYLKGWSHARWDKTILVARKTTHLPLSLQNSRYTLHYGENLWGFFNDFRDRIEEIIEERTSDTNNPIQEFLRDISLSETESNEIARLKVARLKAEIEEICKTKEQEIAKLRAELVEKDRLLNEVRQQPREPTAPQRIEFQPVTRMRRE